MNDFLLEKKLKLEAPDLHKRMKDSAVVLRNVLDAFVSWFPTFTDHSMLHSLSVLNYANCLLADQTEKLSAEECYVLIMSCYLHDTGMGITRRGFEQFTKEIDLGNYAEEDFSGQEEKIIREFHHEFSGLFIKKYAELFDIPSEELLFAILQVCRGHSKTDLLDREEFPDVRTDNGMIRVAALAAYLRLADELDTGADRNPALLYDTSGLTELKDINSFGVHESIRKVTVQKDRIVLSVQYKEERFRSLVAETARKIQETLDYCREVVRLRSDLLITQEKVETEQV